MASAVTLDDEEWSLVGDILTVMAPVKALTEKLQDRSPNVTNSLFMERLQNLLRALKDFARRDEYELPMVQRLSQPAKKLAELLRKKITEVRARLRVQRLCTSASDVTTIVTWSVAFLFACSAAVPDPPGWR